MKTRTLATLLVLIAPCSVWAQTGTQQSGSTTGGSTNLATPMTSPASPAIPSTNGETDRAEVKTRSREGKTEAAPPPPAESAHGIGPSTPRQKQP